MRSAERLRRVLLRGSWVVWLAGDVAGTNLPSRQQGGFSEHRPPSCLVKWRGTSAVKDRYS